MQSKRIVIAIDGHSSCGKSTFAKLIAKELGYLYIDSGAMYRAVTLACIREGIANEAGIDLDRLPKLLDNIEVGFTPNPKGEGWLTTLNGQAVEDEIRTLEVSNLVSPVSAIPMVRSIMTRQQQEMGRNKGIVMDGRDIGTVVFPQAELKIFMTASPEIRAQRRLKEMHEKGQHATFEEVLANVRERDRIDQSREVAPLRQADDAIILDNSYMTVPQQMEWVKRIVEEKMAR
ncbi:MAG: (d)CMP kinase [Tenuifilaceae bacterium]|jgi:cytidylate kinase|nr:(d)CMP kinase [Bacteroidales bacterium]MDI9516124.1 (d)CMP kinase [Bacteroidota bacterium]NLH57162.1 (d)CMP kinase [Rikenellaceae bacterium]OQC63786.1 MAG: Cytidylate kinase [Bacteroidetes bacterium ADurb.Bin008]HNV82506.1 (d)CMP kinase [Tenuifilaceae bacterium]